MKKDDMAQFMEEFRAMFLEVMSELMGNKEDLGPVATERDEMFPQDTMFDPENIDYNDPAFASGVSLGLPKDVSVNKFTPDAKLSGYGYSLSKGKKGVKFNQDMGEE